MIQDQNSKAIQAAIRGMRRELKVIPKQAEELKREYLAELNRLRKKHREGRYHAGLCPKVDATPKGRLGFYWEKMSYLGKKPGKDGGGAANKNAGRAPVAKYIRRNKHGRPYSYERLTKLVEPWETQLVWETEEAAQVLRERSVRLMTAIDQLEDILAKDAAGETPVASTG